jgi:hypothetical protein
MDFWRTTGIVIDIRDCSESVVLQFEDVVEMVEGVASEDRSGGCEAARIHFDLVARSRTLLHPSGPGKNLAKTITFIGLQH